ncbi:MAG TPA: hypothetical protein VIJ94_19370 [Caulobacteraceae bacterium]
MSATSAPDFLIVLSLERCGSTSVYRALRRTVPSATVLHVHFLDGDAYRQAPADPAEAAAFESKRERELKVRSLLADPSLNGAVFTILRDRLSRLISCLWYAKHDVLAGFYDAAADRMHPDALKAVAKRIDLLLDKERNYDRNVYEVLGLPGRPAPGAHATGSGARLFALDFRRIGEDFEAATAAVLGSPVKLPHENAGSGIGDPRGYAAFRRLCAEALPPERLGLVS